MERSRPKLDKKNFTYRRLGGRLFKMPINSRSLEPSEQEPLKPLRRSVPEATVPERHLDLSSDGVLTAQQKTDRDLALDSLARLRRIPPDDTIRI